MTRYELKLRWGTEPLKTARASTDLKSLLMLGRNACAAHPEFSGEIINIGSGERVASLPDELTETPVEISERFRAGSLS